MITFIRAWIYLKFSQIRPRTTDLAVLQRLKLMLPPFLGKLVAIHLIHFKFVGFEDMQQILHLNMGLSVVEHLKTYDAEKVVSTFLGCFQSNPFRCREADKHRKDRQIFTISTGIKSVRYQGKIAAFRHFPYVRFIG